MRVVQAQPGALTLHRTKEFWARTGKVWQSSGDAEVQMRLHFQFNFTVQFKSPYSLSSNFIFSISNITISFQKLILRVARRRILCLVQGSETKKRSSYLKEWLRQMLKAFLTLCSVLIFLRLLLRVLFSYSSQIYIAWKREKI